MSRVNYEPSEKTGAEIPISDDKKKFRLVDWKFICQPKKNGGLGISEGRPTDIQLYGKVSYRLGRYSKVIRFQVGLGSNIFL